MDPVKNILGTGQFTGQMDLTTKAEKLDNFLRDYPDERISEAWNRESEQYWNQEWGFMDMRDDKKKDLIIAAESFIRKHRLRR